MARVLVADDHDAVRDGMAISLSRLGHEVVAVRGGAEAIAAYRKKPADVVVTDLRMAPVDGIEVVRRLRELDSESTVIVISAHGTIPTAVEAMRAGAVHYLTKPADANEVIAAFEGEGANESPPSVPSLARVEWEHIQRVLHSCDGNLSAAARLLGLHRRTLQRKLNKTPSSR